MKTINKFFMIAFAGLAMISCDDIIEHDISNDSVTLISPLNEAEIESNVVAFKWNALEHADKYRIQVFGVNQALALDSIVDTSHLTIPMAEGSYQWRVRGENSAYVSAYSWSMGFTLIESSNLENQQVILSSPGNALYTNNSNITCTWESLQAADDYTFELVNVTEGNIVTHHQENITGTSFSLSSTLLNEDAQYSWKVKAVNAEGSTQFSSRNLYRDTVVPNASVNAQPVNNSIQIAGQQINFSWSQVSDTGIIQSPVSYIIEIANDSGFANVILTSPSLSVNSYQTNFTATGDYYWRVRATDMAGNQSVNSSYFKFTIN
jgi:hypothetical protein